MEKATIIVDGKLIEYESEDKELTFGSEKEIAASDGEEILKKTKKLLDGLSIDLCLSFGTLLGAVRDGAIIKGDQDVDVFVTDENKLKSAIPFLIENGLKLIRVHEGDLYTFRTDERCYIDIYILRSIKGSIWKYRYYSLNGWAMPKKFFQGFDKIVFGGEQYTTPWNPERLLEWWYGKNWRIPQNKKGRYEVWHSRLWRILKYYIHRIIQLF